jgi:uncharacterized protein YbjT (DUF2867 family)
MHILLAGATGLVGQSVLDGAVGRGDTVTSVGRRASGRATTDIITDFAALPDLPEADVAICTLGTTIAAAGSRAAFRAVDHDAVLEFARGAQNAGVAHFLVVTAVGANPGATVFYSRVKGETEQDLEALGFHRLDILQPGLLLGPRQERRPVEAMLQRLNPVIDPFMLGPLNRYAGISVQTVAAALLALSHESPAGLYRHQNRDMQTAANRVASIAPPK